MSGMAAIARLQRRAMAPRPKRNATRSYVKGAINRLRTIMHDVTPTAAQNASRDVGGEAIINLTPLNEVDTGEKGELFNVMINYHLVNAASAGTALVRLVVLQWFPDTGSQNPTKALVLEGATGAVSDMIRPHNIASGGLSLKDKKFKIIRDFVVRLGEATSVEGNEQSIGRIFVTQKQLPRKWLIATAADGVGFNNVFLMAFSQVADASTPPTIEVNSTTKYKTKIGVE